MNNFWFDCVVSTIYSICGLMATFTDKRVEKWEERRRKQREWIRKWCKTDVSHRSVWVWWSTPALRSETSLCWWWSCRDSACSSLTMDFFPPSLVWWRPSSGTLWSPPISWLLPTNRETYTHTKNSYEYNTTLHRTEECLQWLLK